MTFQQLLALSELEAFDGLDLYFLDYSDNFKDINDINNNNPQYLLKIRLLGLALGFL